MRHAAQIARFEFLRRMRRLSSWVYFAVFFSLSALWMAAAGGAFADADLSMGTSHVAINSPYALARVMVILTAFATIVIAALMGRAVQDDIESRSASFFATAPIGESAFLLGRFVGAFAVLAWILLALPLGAFFATLLPGLEPSRLEHNRLLAYLMPYVLLSLPDALVIGSVFFFLAALTKRMLPVYIGSVLLLVLWVASAQWAAGIDARGLANLVDPFGMRAVTQATRYWTAPERNHRSLVLAGPLLANRLTWLALALTVAAFGRWRFSLARYAEPLGTARPTAGFALTERLPPTLAAHAPTRPAGSFWPLTRMYLRSILRSVYFGVLVFAGIALAVALALAGGRIYGTATWPVTFQMIDLLSAPFTLFMLAIITFYAGEVVWHERDLRIDQMVDAAPSDDLTRLLARLLALMAVPALLEGVLILAGVALQLSQGYSRLQLGLYVHALMGIQLLDLWLYCVLALAVHTLVNQKYLGHFLMVLFYVWIVASSGLGFEDNLYKFGETGEIVYSDMNGFGHALVSVRMFELYWAAAALVLLVAAYLALVRGTPASWRERLTLARRRFGLRVRLATALGASLWLASGAVIFYNTHVLNPFITPRDEQQGQADYERTYRALAAMAQPKISAVQLQIDLDPLARSVRMVGHYALENRTTQQIDRLNLDFPADRNIQLKSLRASVANRLVIDDQRLGMRQMHLSEPLAPGASMALDFEVDLTNPGFTGGHEEIAVVGNGSFFNGRLLLPHLGYDRAGEIARAADRKKFALPPRPAMRAQDDPIGLATSYIADDADGVDFAVDISTAPDQLAVAPGRLMRTYERDGRRHYVYRSTQPILNFFAFQSARYARHDDVWHGPNGDIPITIDYQPGHEFDLTRMSNAVKDALAYNTANFSPYQYGEFRIVEFPRYQLFAESFPNTTPYSEGVGFIARVNDRDPRDIDYPTFITAHEVSHQWWGYQLVGANVAGATMLSESLAQYSALMVLKHRYGDARMRRFLAFELDSYLTGRANESEHEVPLAQVENQTYIHYAKGSLVMYALQDALGEARVNQVLADMLKAHPPGVAPYPTSSELVQRFKAAAAPELREFVSDLFERIILFDNRALSAHATRRADGTYLVSVAVHAEKRRADEAGNEQTVPLDDWIDVGVLDAAGDALALRKVHFTSAEQELSFVVGALPARAGIDPLHKLIDRTPSENTVAVQLQPAQGSVQG